jgi:hypothetical protein
MIAATLITFLFIVDFLDENIHIKKKFTDKSQIYIWMFYIFLVIAIIFLGENGSKFIYFQF